MAVSLCGPCLHDLPGMGRDRNDTLSIYRYPLNIPHDLDDSCSVCHYLTLSQLPGHICGFVPSLMFVAWLMPTMTSVNVILEIRNSQQRAPPLLSA